MSDSWNPFHDPLLARATQNTVTVSKSIWPIHRKKSVLLVVFSVRTRPWLFSACYLTYRNCQRYYKSDQLRGMTSNRVSPGLLPKGRFIRQSACEMQRWGHHMNQYCKGSPVIKWRTAGCFWRRVLLDHGPGKGQFAEMRCHFPQSTSQDVPQR